MENYKFITPPCSSADLKLFIQSIDSTFDLAISGKYMLKDVEVNMISEGINTQIDELNVQNDILYSKLRILRNHILSLLNQMMLIMLE